jgi:TonB family protein
MSLGQVNRGLNLLGQGGAATAARMARVPEPPPAIVEPKLAIAWGDFHQGFFSSVRALFSGPFRLKKFLGSDYFRDCWVERRVPKRAVFAAALWHIVFLVSPFALLQATLFHNPAFDHTQITWSGPIEDFPALEIPAAKPKPALHTDAPKPLAPKGADAFHPRQRIVTDPVRPNHPRQTLINPAAPQIAPKILPNLPNIVQLQAASAPVRPRVEISAAALAKLHPIGRRRVATTTDAPAPVVPEVEQRPAELMLAPSASGPARPKLDLNAGAAPIVAEHEQKADTVAAPELSAAQAANGSANPLIALSASPAPPKPDVQPPAGNLAARMSISPEGKKPGVPSGSPTAPADSGGNSAPANNAIGNSPVAVSISGGNPQPKTNSSALGTGHANLILPSSRSLMSHAEMKPDDAPARSGPPNFATLAPGAKPEQIFEAKHVYTLAVNMANLNSASGSWILNFTELNAPQPGSAAAVDLTGPNPIRKVDPKYPPDLIEQNVQGEVVLYGIIRGDGSVDSIQVVRSVDPQLDANARNAFAQWKFRPALRGSAPVDLEVIAHIPFKIRDDR